MSSSSLDTQSRRDRRHQTGQTTSYSLNSCSPLKQNASHGRISGSLLLRSRVSRSRRVAPRILHTPRAGEGRLRDRLPGLFTGPHDGGRSDGGAVERAIRLDEHTRQRRILPASHRGPWKDRRNRRIDRGAEVVGVPDSSR